MPDTHGQGATAPETKGSTIRWARWYDAASWLLSFGRAGAIRKEIVKVANPQAGERVLDAGCGTGTLAIMMKRYAGADLDVTGIDAAVEMVDVARRKAEKAKQEIKFEPAAIEALPFPDAQFDLATSTFMLHHLPDDLKAKGFAEIARVLKPGGRFVAVDLAGGGRSLPSLIIGLIGHKVPADYTEQLRRGMEEAGLVDVGAKQTKYNYLAFLVATKRA